MTNIVGNGYINFDSIHKVHNVFYVKGLNHNYLSVGQMCRNGYNLFFSG